MIEARATGATVVARVVAGHPCRAEIDGNELLVGTEPLVAQVGNTRWSGEDTGGDTTLRRDGTALVRLHDLPATPEGAEGGAGGAGAAGSAGAAGPAGTATLQAGHGGIEILDPQGATLLRVSADGAVANARGEILRRAEASRLAIKIGDSIVTGTSDPALGVLVTAPELIPEVRALAACHRLFSQEQAARK